MLCGETMASRLKTFYYLEIKGELGLLVFLTKKDRKVFIQKLEKDGDKEWATSQEKR